LESILSASGVGSFAISGLSARSDCKLTEVPATLLGALAPLIP
jgi:hypothetical protein